MASPLSNARDRYRVVTQTLICVNPFNRWRILSAYCAGKVHQEKTGNVKDKSNVPSLSNGSVRIPSDIEGGIHCRCTYRVRPKKWNPNNGIAPTALSIVFFHKFTSSRKLIFQIFQVHPFPPFFHSFAIYYLGTCFIVRQMPLTSMTAFSELPSAAREVWAKPAST